MTAYEYHKKREPSSEAQLSIITPNPLLKTRECAMKPSEIASLSNSS